MTDQSYKVTNLPGPFIAETELDTEIGSTIITLTYQDQERSARNIVASIAPELGSNLFRFRVGEYDLIYSDRELLTHREFTGNFVLWPFPNRVRNKRYTYQGKHYSLEEVKRPEADANLVHGLVFDQPWQFEQPVVTQNSASVTTFIDMTPDSSFYSSYPFPSRLSLTYTLTQNTLTTSYRLHNTGTQTLPFGFALHPYFAMLSGPEETLLSVPAEAVMEADEYSLPTGRVFDLNKLMYAMYDLRSPIPVGHLKLDHVYTHVRRDIDTVIDYRKHRIQLIIATSDDFTHAVVFTPGGKPYFCVEHQTCSTDAINLHNQGPEMRQLAHLLEVAPGESATGTIHYTVRFE